MSALGMMGKNIGELGKGFLEYGIILQTDKTE